MNKITYMLTAGLCALFATACSSDPDGTQGTDEGGQREVRLSASASATVSVSKAAAGFPNDGRVGIIAGYYDSSPGFWTIYDEINDTPATAVTVSADSVYTLAFDTPPRYWPFDNSHLLFLAYTPYSEENTAVEVNYGRTSLTMTLQEDMPEIMYASNNSAYVPYNRDSLVVDLGQFRHALSQLTVKVVADSTMNPAIRLTSLAVATQKKTAVLELLDGDDGILLGTNEDFTYTLESGSVDFSGQEVSHTVLLFPESQLFTNILLTIEDGPLSLPYEYRITDFTNAADPSVPIALERGRNTVLTITIKGTEVEQPNDSTHLMGIVSDWKFQGNLGVTIE